MSLLQWHRDGMAFHSLKSQAFRESKTEGSSQRGRRGIVIKWEEMHSGCRTEHDICGLLKKKKNERRKIERDRPAGE